MARAQRRAALGVGGRARGRASPSGEEAKGVGVGEGGGTGAGGGRRLRCGGCWGGGGKCGLQSARPARQSSSVTLRGAGARASGTGAEGGVRASASRFEPSEVLYFFVRHLSKRLHSPNKTRRERVCSVLLTLRERHGGRNGCVNAPIMLRADTARKTDTVSTHPNVEERLNVTPLVYLVSRRRTRRTRSAPANIVATKMW